MRNDDATNIDPRDVPDMIRRLVEILDHVVDVTSYGDKGQDACERRARLKLNSYRSEALAFAAKFRA